MDTYLEKVRLAVIEFKEKQHLTNADLAKMMHFSYSSIVAKMNGARRWTLTDIRKLNKLGVPVPLFDEEQGE